MTKNVVYLTKSRGGFPPTSGCKSCPKVYLGETLNGFTCNKYTQENAVKNNSNTNGIAQNVMETKIEIDWNNNRIEEERKKKA